MSEATVTEALLLRWNEGPNGRTVTFQLPDDTPQHPFRGLKAGPTHGQRLALSIALIADDETQTEPPKADNQPKEKKRSRAQEAGIACSDARFHVFLREVWGALDVYTEQSARTAVLGLCRGIQSRRELDTNDAAQREWDALYSQFKAWLTVAA